MVVVLAEMMAEGEDARADVVRAVDSPSSAAAAQTVVLLPTRASSACCGP